MVNKHTVDYHPSPLPLTSRIRPLISLWTPKGFVSQNISWFFSYTSFFLVHPTMVAEKFKFMVLRLLANTFASQKIESVHFYLCHQAKLSPKFLSLRTYPYSIFCMGKLMIRNHINWCNHKRQRNHCLSILRKTKKEYFNSLNIKQVSDNKLFWKRVKPFFNDKWHNSPKITLVEENNIISDEEEMANILNNYFINAKKKFKS